MAEKGRAVCVTGAGGFAASWLVKLLLEQGYTVHGTVRDPNDEKNDHLKKLGNATENLRLFKADLLDYVSLSASIAGCEGVFHTACPVPSSKVSNPENEMIAPALDGTLNVLKACSEAKVKRVIVVSSVAAVNMKPSWPHDKILDEQCWSDKEFCKTTEKIYIEDLGSEATSRIQHIKNTFVDLYNVYVDQMAQGCGSSTLSSIASDDGNNCMNGVRSFSSNSVVGNELLELESFLKENSSSQPSKSELDSYFDTPVLGPCNENFDILVWWKEHQGKYPILAMMARDILGIPISTVASESAFSTGGRILDSYRSSLNPFTVESLICCQDWLRQSLEVAPSTTLAGNVSTISLAQKIDAERSDEREEENIPMVDENLGDDEEDGLSFV